MLNQLNACVAQITGFFVAIITVLATCLDAGLQGKAFLTGDVKNDIERLEEGGGAAEAAQGDDLPYRPDWFHFCFALASMYIAMVFTGEILAAISHVWQTSVELSRSTAQHVAYKHYKPSPLPSRRTRAVMILQGGTCKMGLIHGLSTKGGSAAGSRSCRSGCVP